MTTRKSLSKDFKYFNWELNKLKTVKSGNRRIKPCYTNIWYIHSIHESMPSNEKGQYSPTIWL